MTSVRRSRGLKNGAQKVKAVPLLLSPCMRASWCAAQEVSGVSSGGRRAWTTAIRTVVPISPRSSEDRAFSLGEEEIFTSDNPNPPSLVGWGFTPLIKEVGLNKAR